MNPWAKIKFYYGTMLGSPGSTLSATSTASGDYSVDYLYNMMETNKWMAGSLTPPQTITNDAGAGNSKTADYIAIIGHNLKTAGASIYLEYSDDNVNWTEAWSATPADDTVILGEFTGTGAHRYWRMRLFKSPGDFNAAPYITVCIWGNRTELDYASASFDPCQQEAKANVNLSQGGYVAGVHTMYIERRMEITFEDAEPSLYGKVRDWWETNGLKNFFVAWERANSPEEVFLMRPDARFNNPLTNGGATRNITISLIGRKE